ncbi:hypothetical protein F4780DRAFT_784298 [Xylariomycetidae sp. FL0641]|nr:hypothetical protein F4780DRAFT_784298 [Xylariomycetidae sp. FL0641]
MSLPYSEIGHTGRVNSENGANQLLRPRERDGYLQERPRIRYPWDQGAVAYLRPIHDIRKEDRAEYIDSGYIPSRAIGHPCIILDFSLKEDYYLVVIITNIPTTTVSAYSSGDFNDNLPPWKQLCHRGKAPQHFRAFEGSQRPVPSYDHLKLRDGKQWPKPKASWVYIGYAHIVPSSMLRSFKADDPLHLTSESYLDLVAHMRQQSPRFRERVADRRLCGSQLRNALALRPREKPYHGLGAAGREGLGSKD